MALEEEQTVVWYFVVISAGEVRSRDSFSVYIQRIWEWDTVTQRLLVATPSVLNPGSHVSNKYCVVQIGFTVLPRLENGNEKGEGAGRGLGIH